MERIMEFDYEHWIFHFFRRRTRWIPSELNNLNLLSSPGSTLDQSFIIQWRYSRTNLSLVILFFFESNGPLTPRRPPDSKETPYVRLCLSHNVPSKFQEYQLQRYLLFFILSLMDVIFGRPDVEKLPMCFKIVF